MAGWICSAEMSPLICMQIPLFFPKCALFVESYGTVVKGRVQKSIDQLMSEYSQSDSSTYLSKYVISIYLLLILLSIHLYVWLSNSLCTHSSIYKNLSISIHPSLNFKSFEFYLFKFESKPFWMLHIPGIQATIWPWLLLHCHGQCEATASFTVKFKANSAQSSGTWSNTTPKYDYMFIMLQ